MSRTLVRVLGRSSCLGGWYEMNNEKISRKRMDSELEIVERQLRGASPEDQAPLSTCSRALAGIGNQPAQTWPQDH